MDNMRKYISDMGNMSKIFLADYDSYSIKHYSISLDYLIFISKAALLLYDVILVPAAFFWQSKEMIDLTLSLQEPLEYGFIAPVIRNYNITSDIYEYYNARILENSNLKKQYSLSNKIIKSDLETGIFSEITTSKDRANALKLEKMSHAAYSDIYSVKHLFIENWKEDISNLTDLNSIGYFLNFCKMPREINESLLGEVKNTFFSRASCIYTSQKVISDFSLQKVIENRISWLYLKSVSEAYGSKIYAVNNPYKNTIQEDNIPMMIKALSAIGISPELIRDLTFRDIIVIKCSPEYQNFIRAFRKIVAETSKKQQEINESFKSVISRKFFKERLVSHIPPMDYINNLSSSVFFSLIANALSGTNIDSSFFITFGGISALTFLLKRISRINNTPFLDIQHFIISRKYEERMLNTFRNIGGFK